MSLREDIQLADTKHNSYETLAMITDSLMTSKLSEFLVAIFPRDTLAIIHRLLFKAILFM